jgi:predicted outer membrane protein
VGATCWRRVLAAGTLAQSKGNSQAVKDFGAMMVKDHTDANIAAQAGVETK